MNYKSEKVIPYKSDDSKSVQVEQMFDGIALRYDALNSWLSLGMDMWWRKTALRKLK